MSQFTFFYVVYSGGVHFTLNYLPLLQQFESIPPVHCAALS